MNEFIILVIKMFLCLIACLIASAAIVLLLYLLTGFYNMLCRLSLWFSERRERKKAKHVIWQLERENRALREFCSRAVSEFGNNGSETSKRMLIEDMRNHGVVTDERTNSEIEGSL